MKETNYQWQQQFRELYDKAMVKYRNEHSQINSFFTPREVRLLQSFGAKPIELYDFAEDSSDLDADTALLIAAVRRDYFVAMQKSTWSKKIVDAASLPAREAKLDGLAWLPRLIAKANARLRGELPDDVMFCCSGDRKFLRAHDIHPADFLRMAWKVKGDEAKLLAYVKSSP